ncbi:uncharacterized protein METZ01_LOCUS178523 [marine metagenome]|uniref:Uncharacterized protein n=1 Tax=marine metagenome TaxID=408172 RepID=A0A382CIJ6_9ZZZZ
MTFIVVKYSFVVIWRNKHIQFGI